MLVHLMPAKEPTFKALIVAYGPALARLWDSEEHSPGTAWELTTAVLAARDYVLLASALESCDQARWTAADDAFAAAHRALDGALYPDGHEDEQVLLRRAERHLRIGLALATTCI
ncbi:hypothetical protein [Streptomyces sp. WZ-12]|uniref:hypothetical protein n=1 Tax=Streptomyces sp. WZ-12 TaxID=3030210 RepID=UPI0023818001|nr:hypothetical protein [Streptomyces sp. WZ-12]